MKNGGLSEATIEKFIDSGFIHSFADIFHLKEHADEICRWMALVKVMFQLIASIDKARKVKLPALIYALGIVSEDWCGNAGLCASFPPRS